VLTASAVTEFGSELRRWFKGVCMKPGTSTHRHECR
jgi:hypothetical protein